ncbi:MAG: tryptophan--tRNA ligase [Methanobacteriota archaeon]|nr:MAG: tryptophan--tRNA ligase [Euryarchaeota archaeon]
MAGKDDFIVTPWEVSGEIDYDRLIEKFGTQRITKRLLQKMEKHAGGLHPMLRRGIFYSHRDFDKILSGYERGEEFYLYTGRGPSGHTHLGHLMPWIFTKHLQDVFRVKLIFQLTDDEKFMFSEKMTLEDSRHYAYENALDVIALGFDPKRTEIFLDTEYIKSLYKIAIRVAKRVTFSTAKAVFGFKNSTNIGLIFFTSIQSAPAFLESERQGRSVPCLIPCAIDQDPHFRVTRDVAPFLGYPKPALVHTKFFPSLLGSDKMSSSRPEGSIYTTDSPEAAKKKVMNAFTGGCATVAEQKKLGGKPDICPVYQYLAYIFEEEDAKLKEQYMMCRSGELLCGEHKQYLAGKVLSFLEAHQERREKARDLLEDFIIRD